MKKVFKYAIAAVFAVAALLIALSLYNGGGSVEAISTTIGGSIKEIGELATSEYGYTMAETMNKPKKEIAGLKIPFTGSKVVYSYDGMIKAGVDFNEIKVDVTDDKITVTMPEAKILSSEVDNDSLVVYDEKNSPFNSIKFEDMNLSVTELKEAAESSAKENGLLERAAANARSIVESMVKNVDGGRERKVVFK